ncbi:von Willebrand factor C and EGF domain-containing protein-like [Anabrus simplex]|uniref:von Willebrand factor C and EGF domain-containing protein-like n=1 Tax=Anabrus simplex TaxID=316456 RepID=UPI0035A38871
MKLKQFSTQALWKCLLTDKGVMYEVSSRVKLAATFYNCFPTIGGRSFLQMSLYKSLLPIRSMDWKLTGGSLECDLRRCNLANIQYYLELDCRPIREPGICCPHSFDCSDMLSQWQKRNKYKCYFKNHVFELGARPSEEDVYGPCLSDCVCFYNSTRSYVKCSAKQCPESRQPPLAKGCVRQYFTDSCCSTGVTCASNSTFGWGGFDFTCTNGNSSFLEGEIFSPMEQPCKRCMCQRGYNDDQRVDADDDTGEDECNDPDCLSCGLLEASAEIVISGVNVNC